MNITPTALITKNMLKKNRMLFQTSMIFSWLRSW